MSEEVKDDAAQVTAEEVKDTKKDVEMTPEQKEFVDKVETMSVMELSKLVKVLEDKFGVSAAAPMAMMAGGAAGGFPLHTDRRWLRRFCADLLGIVPDPFPPRSLV